MKKIGALLLCLCMLLSMAACSADQNGEVPDGMQIASAAGADYYLYVPTTWNLNTHYGISGAYFDLNQLSNVSVQKYAQTNEIKAAMQTAAIEDSASARIDWYYRNYCRPIIEEMAFDASLTNEDVGSPNTTLGGANAMQYHHKAIMSGSSVRIHQVIAERQEAFYVFTFSAVEKIYDMLWTDVQTMVQVFRFSDTPYQPEIAKPLEGDEKTPAGMKLASNDEVAYSFYVPTSWKVDQAERIFSAYVEEDRASVSVVPYMPDAETMKVADFTKMTRDKLIEIVGEEGYVQVEEEDLNRRLGGRAAVGQRYRLTIDGKTYEYLQIVAAYKSMIYSVTYTAPTEEIYEKHIAEVEQIIAAFAFR